ncbi:MAG TPA: peptidase M28 family protein, partial [Ferruginibacter sp.]|nr:peptidase M28 family protein [Ferruginibacter sp.]
MKKKLFTALLVLIFGASNSPAQNADSLMIRNMANEILTQGTAYKNLEFICKKIGPRLSGSANAAKAIQATTAMLKEVGADTVYLQPCMVPHWVRGAKEIAYAVLPGNKQYQLNVCAIGNTVATKPGGVLAEVVEVKSME